MNFRFILRHQRHLGKTVTAGAGAPDAWLTNTRMRANHVLGQSHLHFHGRLCTAHIMRFIIQVKLFFAAFPDKVVRNPILCF